MSDVIVTYKMDGKEYTREMQVADRMREAAAGKEDSFEYGWFIAKLSDTVHSLEEIEAGAQMPAVEIMSVIIPENED